MADPAVTDRSRRRGEFSGERRITAASIPTRSATRSGEYSRANLAHALHAFDVLGQPSRDSNPFSKTT